MIGSRGQHNPAEMTKDSPTPSFFKGAGEPIVEPEVFGNAEAVMRNMLMIPIALLLAGCPTPPESGPGTGGGPGAAGGAGGAGAGGPGAGGNAGGAGNAGNAGAGGNLAGNAPGGPAVTPVGNPETGSILIKITGDISSEPDPSKTQDAIKSGDHVTFSGTASCDDCSESLLVRVMPFVNPEEAGSGTPPGPITTKKLTAVGNYSVLVPKGSTPVVLELLADANDDGKPNAGERLAVLEKAGALKPQGDESSLDLDATDRASTFGDGAGANAPNQPDQSGGGANTGDNIGPAGTPPDGGTAGPPGSPPADGGISNNANNAQGAGTPPPTGNGGGGAPPTGGDAATNGPSDAPTDGTNIGPPGPPPDGGGAP
jgi:hypothetical protein